MAVGGTSAPVRNEPRGAPLRVSSLRDGDLSPKVPKGTCFAPNVILEEADGTTASSVDSFTTRANALVGDG